MDSLDSGRDLPHFDIERIQGPGGESLEFSAQRGGIIKSLALDGTELLYWDKKTFQDPAKNVRGGIPILFPAVGPVEDPHYPGMKQHGFARNMRWDAKTFPEKGAFSETLRHSPDTLTQYPHEFELEVGGSFDEGALKMYQRVSNTGSERLPVAMGLHPYFLLPQGQKPNISFDFDGGAELKAASGDWMNGNAAIVDNPGGPLNIRIPGHGLLTLTASREYKRIQVWSLADNDFVCVEPVMRGAGGLSNDPELIEPGGSYNARFTVGFQRER